MMQSGRPFRRCKACQSCREKKTRCDGQQPSCTPCQQNRHLCRYSRDKRQTSRVTKDSIDTVYNKIASLELLVKSLEGTAQRQGSASDLAGSLVPLTPSPTLPSDRVESRLPSSTNTVGLSRINAVVDEDGLVQASDSARPLECSGIGDEIRTQILPTSSFDPPYPTPTIVAGNGRTRASNTVRHLDGFGIMEGIRAETSPTEYPEAQSGAVTDLMNSDILPLSTRDPAEIDTGPDRFWNRPASPRSTYTADHQRAASPQDRDDLIVSGLHMRVSNSVHGLTSTFHPQPFSPSTSSQLHTSESPAQETSGSLVSKTPQQRERDDEEVRARLFTYAALEKQKEYAYRTERRYDLDGVDYDTAMHLLDLHWNHQHCAYLVSYRPALLHSLAANGPHANKLLLNAIYYSSSLNSDRSRLHEIGPDGRPALDQFLVRFQELLLPELQRSTISSVSAFLQMGSSLFASGNQTAGWLYSGIGYRMIIDLGLHLDPGRIQSAGSNGSTPDDIQCLVDIELQKRVFWGAYVNDKFQSLFFGRPPALPATGAEPPQTLFDSYEELELWSPYIDPQTPSPLLSQFSPTPGHVISTFKWLLRLAEISSSIIEHFYMPAMCKMKSSTVLGHLSRIRNDLDRWIEDLPAHLRFDPEKDPAPPAHQFNIHTTYCTLHILLYRPFLAEGHLKHFCVNEKANRDTCVWAALRIYRLAVVYRNTFTLRRAPYLFSYALFSAATVIPTHDSPGWTHLARKEITVFFWDALIELQKGSNLGLKRPIKILRDFMERAGVDVQSLAARLETPPKSPLAASANVSSGEPCAAAAPNFTGDSRFLLDSNEFRIPDLNVDNLHWLDDIIDPGFGEDGDMLYGLFRSS